MNIEIASASLFWSEGLMLELHILRSEAMLATLKRHGSLGGISLRNMSKCYNQHLSSESEDDTRLPRVVKRSCL
jgi:hypothetical protein